MMNIYFLKCGSGTNTLYLKEKNTDSKIILSQYYKANSTLPFTVGLNFPLIFEQFNSFITAAG